MMRNIFGQRVRLLRKTQNLTQEELAEKAGLSYKFIGEIERGAANPTLDTIEKIASALGVYAALLLSEKEERFSEISDEEKEIIRQALAIMNNILGK